MARTLALLFSFAIAAVIVIAGWVGYPYVAKVYDGIKVKLPDYPAAQEDPLARPELDGSTRMGSPRRSGNGDVPHPVRMVHGP